MHDTPGLERTAAARRWCPESDLNQRPTAYEAVALPLSYRGFRLRPAPAYLADCRGRAKARGASPGLAASGAGSRGIAEAGNGAGRSASRWGTRHAKVSNPPHWPHTGCHSEFTALQRAQT